MKIEELARSLRDLVGSLDADTVPAQRALELVEMFAEIERLAVAGRTLLAARVVETRAWRRSGATSAATWMAARAGTTVTQAAATLETSMRLNDLPAVRDALVAGKLSEQQATEIAVAAAADPSAERGLLKLAEHEGVAKLRERCRDVRAAAAGDEDARERIRRSRYFRHWTERDGAVRLDGRLAPDDAAPLLAAVHAHAGAIEREARRAGHSEPPEAFAADALVSLASEGAHAPKTVVQVLVSKGAYERGYTVAGETCRVPGMGPISVAAARKMAARGAVKVIETDGVDVTRVAHAGRTIPAHLRSALEARDVTCVVPGCQRSRDLEIDHIVPMAEGGDTKLTNLARLCRWHHAEKTHHGWELGGAPGAWTWTRKVRR